MLTSEISVEMWFGEVLVIVYWCISVSIKYWCVIGVEIIDLKVFDISFETWENELLLE